MICIALTFTAVLFVACEKATDETVKVTAVALNKTAISLEEGETETLVATVTPDNATDKTVKWSTSSAAVATVSNGKVTAAGKGTAKITAKAGDKSAVCEVTVTDALTDATLGSWTADRTDPKEWKEEDGVITFTTNEEPNNDWYSWNGRQASTDMETSTVWEVKSTLNVTSEMLSRDGVRTSMWLNVQDGENNNIDWAIVQFYGKAEKEGEEVKYIWQYWDSDAENGGWIDIEGVTPTAGEHELCISYADRTISISIDGKVEATYKYADEVTACKAAQVILQSYSFGESYTVSWSVPSVRYLKNDEAE